jgi:hypothetical protein
VKPNSLRPLIQFTVQIQLACLLHLPTTTTAVTRLREK